MWGKSQCVVAGDHVAPIPTYYIPVIHTDTAATDNLWPLDNLPVTTSNEEQSAITHFLPRGSVARGQKSGGRWWVLKEVTNVADYLRPLVTRPRAGPRTTILRGWFNYTPIPSLVRVVSLGDTTGLCFTHNLLHLTSILLLIFTRTYLHSLISNSIVAFRPANTS